MPDQLTDLERAERVREPHAMYVTREDALRVVTLSAAAGAVILSGRVLGLDGRIVPFEQRCVLANDRSTPASLTIPLSDGWLMSLSAVLEAGAVAWGQAFVRVDVTRGAGAIGTVLATLMQGTVTDVQRRAWPGSAIAGALEAPGTVRSITGTNPAAGANGSETVPAGARWRLLSFMQQLNTDATVANRELVLVFGDGTSSIARMPAGVAHVASFNRLYTFSNAGVRGAAAITIHNIAVIPSIVLLPGWTIGTEVTNMQAGDDLLAPQMVVEEFFEGA